MSPTDIADRLEQRFSLLTSGARTAESAPADAAGHRRLELHAAHRVANSVSSTGSRSSGEAGPSPRPRRSSPTTATAPRRGARHHRPAGRAIHGGRRARGDYPLPDAGDAAPVRRRAARCQSGEADELARRHAALLPRHGARRPRWRCAAMASAPPSTASARTSPTSGRPHLARRARQRPGLGARDGRRPRPVLAPRPPPRGTRAPRAACSRRTPARPPRGRSALQAVSLVERPRACLVHPSPRCAETARESLATLRGARRPVPRRAVPSPARRPGRDRRAPRTSRSSSCAEAEAQFAPRRRSRGAPRSIGLRAHGDRAQDRRRGRTPSRSAAPPLRRSGSSTTPGGSRRSCTTSGGGCGSSAATRKPRGSSRRRSTSPPRPGSTTPSSGRWPTSASARSTWATGSRPPTCSTVRPPPRSRSATAPERSWPATVGLLAQVDERLGRAARRGSPRRCRVSSASAPLYPRACHWPDWPAATRPRATFAAPVAATNVP